MQYKGIAAALIFLITTTTVFSQELCSENLNFAEEEFSKGKLYAIPDIISDCIQEGFTKEEKIRAYRLLALSYTYLDYHNKADEAYLELLRLSPEYSYNEEIDPKEIINLHNRFTTKPFVYIAGRAGVNFTRPSVMVSSSATNSLDDTKKYRSLTGFQFGGGAEIMIKGNFDLLAELYFSQKTFKVTDSHFFDNFYTTQINFVRYELEFPVMLRYTHWSSKVSPFANFGASPTLLIDANAVNQGATYVDEEFGTQGITGDPPIDISKTRRQLNYSLLGGVGFNYKIGINYLSFEVRYSVSMFNAIEPKENMRLDLQGSRELKFFKGVHIDDDYRLNTFSFLVGFVRPLYKPRKIVK